MSLTIGVQRLTIGLVLVVTSSFTSLKRSKTGFLISSYNFKRSAFNSVNSAFSFLIFSPISGSLDFNSSTIRSICWGINSLICLRYFSKISSTYNNESFFFSFDTFYTQSIFQRVSVKCLRVVSKTPIITNLLKCFLKLNIGSLDFFF